MSAEGRVAATLFGPRDLRLVSAAVPGLAPGMVRVAFGAGGICGSDMHYYRHARTGDFVVTSPLVLGHEIAGTIIAMQDPAPGLSVGDRVAINPSRWCGTCRPCRTGRPNLCENIYFMGSASKTPHMQGGFASHVDVIPAQCVAVPAHVPFAAAALAEPLAVCLHAVARAGPLSGASVLVIGAGPIGLLTMLAARQAGAALVAMADIAAAPLSFAARLGADQVIDLSLSDDALQQAGAATPFDVVFEASGAPPALASALLSVRRGGIVVQIGNLPAGPLPLPGLAVMAREIDLRGSFRFGDEFSRAVALIAEGAIDVTAIITASRPLSQAPEAFELALDRSQSMKVMLLPDGAHI
ncbi:MAG: L-idonate 5-dehydrogenase [Beijerinckiaceae bacterium]|nr:L-idonate 5-dehydrogenase [Beijerinckiaceae bacterium]